jgi:rhamnosyltransferase
MFKVKEKDYAAVVVTYYPDLEHLSFMIKELVAANVNVVIYDNTPSKENRLSDFKHNEGVHIIANGNNDGLGRAFNASIEFLKTNLMVPDAVLFFDQDSTIKKSKLQSLISELEWLQMKGWPVGTLGACPVDSAGNIYRVRDFKKTSSSPPEGFSLVSFVISSFSIVPYEVFQKVGFFDERLFIDLVDSEFSWRCSKYGLLNLRSKKTKFTHIIGKSRKKIFNRSFSISSPSRNYYQARNLIIVGRDYGWYWYIVFGISRRFIQICLSGYHERNLWIRLKYFSKGVYHGFINKTD